MVKKILSPGPFPRRPSGFVRYIVFAILALFAFLAFHRSSRDLYASSSNLLRPLPDGAVQPTPAQDDKSKWEKIASKPHTPVSGDKKVDDKTVEDKSKPPASSSPGPDTHPIDKLIYDAQHVFAELASKESKTVEDAAKAYRKRRGRHPPPGFDKWYEFARSKNALVIEDFFDQIHHDLEPFWGMDPLSMRRRASQFEMTINVRNGNASAGSDWFWTKIWLEMIKEIEGHLPDMDIALNAMDEPRIVAPWEEIDKHMKKAAKTKRMYKSKDVITEHRKLPKPMKGELAFKVPKIDWERTKHYWSIVRRGCSPSSPAREAPMQQSFADPPVIDDRYAKTHLYKGYVSNYTLSTEFCHQPDLQGLEGILIEPISTASTKIMFPLFGGSKLAVNNEILLPAPMYWSEEERFTGGGDHGGPWAEKINMTVWRGVATGGRNHESNWRGFQRHRFVSMGNGTKLTLAEKSQARAENFALPQDIYDVTPYKEGRLGEWIEEVADVGFVDLFCDEPQDGLCNYTDFYFSNQPSLKMSEQFFAKYLPDIDGNSFSGRYLGFLKSTSLPIKATVWREWHDSRLVAWKHFVPMDNRFSDFYGIMEYFLGYKGKNSHDSVAEKIATDGKKWAEKVLRKEDMLVYVLRLLLEYARVVDDRRDAMGWVGDAIQDPSLEDAWGR
ncbi:hypothetical protein HIM_02821 [Hirsutella minnesotensis 3608]|nr:hypothetical protein HIM_02821 [Hirsutella minnesotensis 3608]